MKSTFNPLLESDLQDKLSIIMGYLVAHLFSAKIVGEVFLIGSYARGNYDSESDIDLMISADAVNTKKVATIASKLEWTFEIPVQVISINDLDERPLETLLLYSSIQRQTHSFYYLITYHYLTKNRSKMTVFNRSLKKSLSLHGGKKIGPRTLLLPIQIPMELLFANWENLIKLQEKLLITINSTTN